MDIELFKTFLEVNNTRHFGKASENLYLTQAAVSARIKLLEDSLGVTLFTRARNNIQLTPEGERLLPHAETMLMAWARARQEVALKEEQTRQLTLATTAGLWRFVLQDRLPSLHDHFPELALRAEACSSDELLRLLSEKVVDLGFLFEPAHLSKMTTRALGKLKLVMFSNQVDAKAKEATRQGYIYVDWGTAFAMFHSKRFPDFHSPILRTNMASIAETYLLERGGAAYLPDILAPELESQGFYPVSDAPSFSKDIYALFATNTNHTDVIDELIEQLKLQS